jgi:hypothetical protein
MRCQVLTEDGRLLTEGLCGIRRDGRIELVADAPSGALRQTRDPLVLATGSSRYAVRVEGMHGSRNESLTGPIEVYHLVPTAA